MDDSLQNNRESRSREYHHAIELGKLLHDHNGGDVVVMDMAPLDYWTDYFVIATVTSSTHMAGLERRVKDYIRENDLEILYPSRRPAVKRGQDSTETHPDEWHLIDLGEIIIHLMTDKSRSFYELERLWSAAPLIYQGNAHSSKSS